MLSWAVKQWNTWAYLLDEQGWFIRQAKVKGARGTVGEDPSAHACCWRGILQYNPAAPQDLRLNRQFSPQSCQSSGTSRHHPSASSDWLIRFTCKLDGTLLMQYWKGNSLLRENTLSLLFIAYICSLKGEVQSFPLKYFLLPTCMSDASTSGLANGTVFLTMHHI